MAEYKNGSLDGKALAERKSKRLEEALSAFSAEQTKETVSKLLEEYVDESGKNYFGAGTRDTTLYFADDDYIKEIEKEKSKNNNAEKNTVANTLHKLTSIIPKAAKKEDEEVEKKTSVHTEKLEPLSTHKASVKDIAAPSDKAASEPEQTVVKPEPEQTAAEPEIVPEEKSDETKPAEKSKPEKENKSDEKAESIVPESEPTIVITPVKEDGAKKETPVEEDTNEMRREFFDNEIEVDEVPRRRRKQAEDETASAKKSVPEVIEEDDDDFDDVEEEDDEKKSKFGGFFKRKRNDDPFDDDFDDEFDDDDYYDDDDDYYDEGITFKKVVNVIVIIALVCSTAFFAASNYSNLKKLESANSQINELNNGSSSNSTEEIDSLKTQIEELKAENEKLKGTPSTTDSSNSEAEANSTDDDDNSESGSGDTYTIQSGDTGYKICMSIYGQYTEELWQDILDANGMSTSTVYHPGDVLQIP